MVALIPVVIFFTIISLLASGALSHYYGVPPYKCAYVIGCVGLCTSCIAIPYLISTDLIHLPFMAHVVVGWVSASVLLAYSGDV